MQKQSKNWPGVQYPLKLKQEMGNRWVQNMQVTKQKQKKNSYGNILFNTLFTDCEQLIRHMLVLDPVKRYNTQQILNHSWTKMGGADPTFDQMMEDHKHQSTEDTVEDEEPINEAIVQQIENLGLAMVNRDMIIQVSLSLCLLSLKELAMIFAGQENPLIIFRRKEIGLYIP